MLASEGCGKASAVSAVLTLAHMHSISCLLVLTLTRHPTDPHPLPHSHTHTTKPYTDQQTVPHQPTMGVKGLNTFMEEDSSIKRSINLRNGACPPIIIDAAAFVGSVGEHIRNSDDRGLWKVGGGLQAFAAEANRRLNILETIAPSIHIVSAYVGVSVYLCW